MKWIFLAFSICFLLAGCDVNDGTSFALNLDKLNWQTGALIGLAYLANSRGHFSALATAGLSVLRSLKFLPAADSQKSLTSEDVAKRLAELYVILKGYPEIQDGILKLMKPGSTQTQRPTLPPPPNPQPGV